MATDVTIGVLMSSGPEVVTDACVGLAGAQFIGMQGPDDLAPHIDELDAIVVSNDFYTPEVARLIHAAPRLRWLQSSSTGYEHLSALGAPKHLAVTEPGSVYSDIVAEHAMALLLALARGVLQMERNRLEAWWDLPKVASTMVSLKDRNLLLIGFGGIGQETAKRARPFGMRITAMVRRPPSPETARLADKFIYREQLHDALAEADAVVLGIPLIADTEKLIGAPEFAAMKRSAFLINMARGPVVDEQALIAALRDGQIAGAGIDVVEKEPLAADSPLWGMERVIISPHLSAYGDGHGSRRFGAMIRENVERFVAGRVLMNPIAGYLDRTPPG
jgi:phosphoglycerate dehydrogenase-like enzyme